MSPFFITGSEPAHSRQGRNVRFFVREQDREKGPFRLHVVEKEIPHYFFTRNMPYEEAVACWQELLQNPALRHLSFSLHRYSFPRGFIRAEGSKEDQEILPVPFICGKKGGKRDPLGLNSPARQLRWFYPPGMLLEAAEPEAIPLPEEIWAGRHQARFASLDELVQDSFATLDIEVKGWEMGRDHIFMVAYSSSRQKLLFHDLPFSDKGYQDYQLVHYSSPKELGTVLTAAIKEDDPLWLFGHNIGYDQLQLRELTQEYFPAANEYYPVTKAVQRLRKVLTKGRFTLDTCSYQANYRNFLANNKLATIAGFEKTLSYAEIAELEEQARKGSREAFRELAHYSREDVEKTTGLALDFRLWVAAKSFYFCREPDSICYTSRLTVAKDYWQRRHFLAKQTFDDRGKRRRALKNFSLDKLKERLVSSPFEAGFFEDVHIVYVTPFIAACGEILQGSPLLQKIKHTESAVEKFDLYQTLQAKLTLLIERIINILDRRGQLPSLDEKEGRWYRQAAELLLHPPALTAGQQGRLSTFLQNHRMGNLDLPAFLDHLTQARQEVANFLIQQEAINCGQYFAAVSNRPAKVKHGFYLGTGPCLSLTEGQFIANPFHEQNPARLIYQGFDPRQGARSNFERRMLQEMVSRIFQREPFHSIEHYLTAEIEEFVFGHKPKEDYYVPQKARRYYREVLDFVLNEREEDPRSNINTNLREEYQRLHRRLPAFAPETQREFQKLVQQCTGDFSYPLLAEIAQEMKHPYPTVFNLVYAQEFEGALVPIGFCHQLALNKYKERIREQFRPWYEALKPRQMRMKYSGP